MLRNFFDMTGPSTADYSRSRISGLWWAGFCLLIVFTVFLYFFRLSTPDFWTDEVLSQVKYDHLVDNLTQIAKDVHPPEYFILSWWWKTTWNPTSEAGFRSFSTLIGVGCVLLSVWLGSRLINRNFGLLAGLVVALSPFFLQYSRMHRYYSLMAFWTLLALVFLLYRGEKNLWWGIRCGSANLGLIYTNYLGAIFILGQAAMVSAMYPKQPRIWGKWLLGQVVLVVGFLPWAFVMTHQAERGNIAYETGKASAPFLSAAMTSLKSGVFKILYSCYMFFVGENTFPWQVVITIPVLIVLVIAVFKLFRAHGFEARTSRIILGYAAVVLVVVIAMSEIYTRVFSFQSFALLPSRLLALVPLFLIAILFGITSMPNRWWKSILVAVLLATEAFGTVHYFAQDQYLNPKYGVPWRKAVEYVVRNSGTASFACTDESSFLYYNRELHGIPTYGVMDLLQGFQDVGNSADTLTLWVISRYRGDPGIRLAYDELNEFCRQEFPVMADTGFGRLNPNLKKFLALATRQPAPDRILEVSKYQVNVWKEGIAGIERAMKEFMDAQPERFQILGWIKADTMNFNPNKGERHDSE